MHIKRRVGVRASKLSSSRRRRLKGAVGPVKLYKKEMHIKRRDG
jgi:hypothetical protein